MDGEQLMSALPAAGGGSDSSGLQSERLIVEEISPTHLNGRRCGRNCKVSEDQLSFEYTSIALHTTDVGAVQGNRPVPQQRLLYYFEITVEDRGRWGRISIGFTDENFRLYRHPGWEPHSYGYHGDDGRLYHGHGRGVPFGPTFSTGDSVGAGINYAAKEVLFTKNGKLVGRTAMEDSEGPLYPTIGLHSLNEKVAVNFGQRPFKFDVAGQEDWVRQQRSVECVPLPL